MLIHEITKHLKKQTFIAVKLANNFKGCIMNILSRNLKDIIEKERVCSLSYTLTSKLEVYLV
jgi:hypothetical protein